MSYSIMVQGTMSNAGKSLIAAALCRIFKQDGYSCAPFKSQNMALNSYVTKNGLEMGRAQVMQAEAAGVEPDVMMNPVLLKPTTDVGSQVIVNGEVRGNMTAAEYFKYKNILIPDIMHAFETLKSKYDIVVIEGAGSPVEMNLKTDDIVNMGLAKMTKTPVLLVGDIDRGGVFAQLLGTLSLLEKDEYDIVKGLIVNKFRGDLSLFGDGVKILEERGGKPVAGVVPYIKCDIDDEDSLSYKLGQRETGIIDIAVVRLPKISNFTDFDVFSQYDGVSVRYVGKIEELENPDFLIIPGTKNTISDMKWLESSGLAEKIKKLSAAGTPVFGICGGYQMLGKRIIDNANAEGGGEINGLGLLDMITYFKGEKTRKQVSGIINCGGIFAALNNAEFEGYEIHMGESISNEKPLIYPDGGAYKDSVYGSYVHGIFDKSDVAGNIVKTLYARKGLEFSGKLIDRRAYKEEQYDILADEVRKSLNMDLIYKILREGI